MDTKDEALKMAIKALEVANRLLKPDLGYYPYNEQINACKEALEQPTQEPVAERFWVTDGDKSHWTYDDYDKSEGWQPLYTHPHQWQGLTAKEIASISLDEYALQKAEKLLKEKNYG